MPSKEQERTEELRPCRCGGKVELKSSNDGYMIVCPECSEGSDLFGCDGELVKSWNTRTSSSRLTELERICEKMAEAITRMSSASHFNENSLAMEALREYEEYKKR